MPVFGLNHAVLYVRDVERTLEFYSSVLGFEFRYGTPGRSAFLAAPGSFNDHDLALFAIGDAACDSDAGRATVGMYHLGWEVDTLAELQRLGSALREVGALVGATDHGASKSLYAKDPDGLEFELAWMVPRDDFPGMDGSARRPLDLRAEIERFGATRLSHSLAGLQRGSGTGAQQQSSE